MALNFALPEHEALAQRLRHEASGMTGREWASATLGAAIFAAVQALLLVYLPPGGLAVGPVALCLAVLVFAHRVRIDTPLGFTVPTQLGFVPLLFAAPPALTPLLACLALTGAALIDVARGNLTIDRLLTMPANCAFALGPPVAFAVAGVTAADATTGLLIAAFACQFGADFTIYALRHVIEGQFSLSEQLRDSWFYVVDAALSWLAVLVARDVHRAPLDVLSLLPLLALLGIFAGERRRRLEGMLELGRAYRGTALLLGDVVEADDGYTGEHCKDVVTLALAVGAELGLDADRRRNLEFGGLLHDVGKIAIPKTIINKPGPLDRDEWGVAKTHTIEGQKMLDRVGGFMREVGLIVRSHHERWDGGGYPDGLRGEQIPLEARIIACCDTWNAMRTDRAYRLALSHEAAMAELLACAGTQLDSRVVAALVRVVEGDRPRADGAGGAGGAAGPGPSGAGGTTPQPAAAA